MLKRYICTFNVNGRRIKWVRFATDIYSALDSLKIAARREFPDDKITGWCVTIIYN